MVTYLARKWDQVMFAQTIQLDILDNHHLVVTLVEQCIVDHVGYVYLVALGEEH